MADSPSPRSYKSTSYGDEEMREKRGICFKIYSLHTHSVSRRIKPKVHTILVYSFLYRFDGSQPPRRDDCAGDPLPQLVYSLVQLY